jgi:hypothetical protein
MNNNQIENNNKIRSSLPTETGIKDNKNKKFNEKEQYIKIKNMMRDKRAAKHFGLV